MLLIPISLLLLRILINFNNVTLTVGDRRTHFECKSYCYPLFTENTRQDSTWIATEDKNYHSLLFYKYPPGGKRAKTRHINTSYTSEFCICKGQSCCSFFSPTINNSSPLKVRGWREALPEHIWLVRASYLLSHGFIWGSGPNAHGPQAVFSLLSWQSSSSYCIIF